MKFKPWGIEGGHDAPLCKTQIISKKQKYSLPGKIDTSLKKGDIIKIHTTGSGGFGSPEKRDPELVLDDYMNKKISSSAAKNIYKVMIKNNQIDYKKTNLLRA